MKTQLLATTLVAATAAFGVQAIPQKVDTLEVGKLIVRDELIVSDTGEAWEDGFAEHMIPRGIYARGGGPGKSGLWVRGRLIQCEIDDPFDTRYHSIYSDGGIHRAPGHISWNCYIDGSWRQMAIIQGEGLEFSEVPKEEWSGGNHPGRMRFQSFRPGHPEPLTDAVIGQGKMSIGGGGYGGGGLPYPSHVLELWGGDSVAHALGRPEAPQVLRDDGSGRHEYSVVGISAQGQHSEHSPSVKANGLATLSWDSLVGADAYLIVRDGQIITDPLRIEGSNKNWTDLGKK